MNYGSGGNGTILHLAAEMFLEEAHVKAKHIPYKGVGPMVTDLIGGQIDFATVALPSVQQHLASGALRVIGIATAAACRRPPPEMPDLRRAGPARTMWSRRGSAVIGPKNLPAARRAAHPRRAGHRLQ